MLHLVPQVPEAIMKCKLVITELYIDNTTFYALPQFYDTLKQNIRPWSSATFDTQDAT